MIQEGFHLYRDDRGTLRLDQIVAGSVNGLSPTPYDERCLLGHYDLDGQLVEADEVDDEKLDQLRVTSVTDHLPGQHNQATHGHGGGAKVSLKKVEGRAYGGAGVVLETKTKLTKQEAGALGEMIAVEYLKTLGHPDAHALNMERSNFPVDMVGDHMVAEVKTGLVSNNAKSHHWRATIGQPGKAESAWLKTASAEDKAAWNAKKNDAIMQRKKQVLKDYSAKLGKAVKGKTITTIINPDTKRADVFMFDGFHKRIPWNGPEAKKAYVGTFSYD